MNGPRILVGHGARATEDVLVARVAELRDGARRDAALVARPVRIVVPSISLSDHLSAVLVRRCGALAGFQVATLFSLALELLRGRGRHPGHGTVLLRVLVERFARLQEPLRERLGDLAGGYGVVVHTVRDFLDAGFDPVHHEGLDELLEAEARTLAGADEVGRARALLNVTAAVHQAFEALELTDRAVVLRQARDALETAPSPPDLLPTRELLVHGFADATGVVTDLLESMLRVFGGTLFLDRPPGITGGFEAAHSERFTVRLSQVARLADGDRSTSASPEVSLFVAPDPDAELREIARRVRRLLDGGVRPEAVGVVARDLSGRGGRVRRHLNALGVPFSAVGAAAPPGRAERDLAVLREVLRRGPALPLERWLDGLSHLPRASADPQPVELDPRLASDLRLAFFALGASRLEDLERIDPGAARREVDAGVPEAGVLETGVLETGVLETGVLETGVLETGVLETMAAAGRSLARELDVWASGGELTWAEHEARLLGVLDRHLGWTPGTLEARAAVDAALEGLEVPRALRLSYEELVLVVLEALAGRPTEPLGGRGGGIRVLDAMESRGLTFEHLFFFAALRDVFPRPVHEDPLLPDRLRRGLSRLLPDLPVKASGFDEERFLFAQLLSSAPRVTVSWHEQDATGQAVALSPLVDRWHRQLDGGVSIERAPRLLELAEHEADPRPIEETLLAAAVHGTRPAFAQLLPLALEEASATLGATTLGVTGDPAASHALTRGRLAVLDELDPDRRQREGRIRSRQLGPYFGFLGAAGGTRDTRREDVFVTTLEDLAVCPWQTFLRRLLRVAPMPDPLASLPTLRGLLVGNLVHRVLRRIATGALGGRSPTWPEAAELEVLLSEAAEGVLADQGLGLKGLARAAVELARPYLEAARRLDWETGEEPAVVRVESSEAIQVKDSRGRVRRVRFKADRVDRPADEVGQVYTDYKTGALRRTRQDVRENLRLRIERGEWLQAAAYAHAEGETRAGRYVFLRPDLDDAERILRLASGDAELRRAFDGSVRTLLSSWDHGTFFPRLVEPDEDLEPPRCAYCRVAEACLRRDSGARGRLRRWAAGLEEAGLKDRTETEEAWLRVWRLRRTS